MGQGYLLIAGSLLELIIDKNFELNSHVIKVLKDGYSTLRKLKLSKRYTPLYVRKQVCESLIVSKLDQARNQRKGGGKISCPLLKKEEKCLDLGKKCSVSVHIWVEFSFKMPFKGCLGEKTPKIFSAGLFLLPVVHEKFIEVPVLQETFPAPCSPPTKK